MTDNNIAIKVENLNKVYKLYNKPIDRLKESLHLRGKKYHKDFYALNDVSFEIKKGETVGIIGKNGSGKSTLLKIITGVLTPSSGKVAVNGKVSALLELGAGFNPEYTGLENIYFQGAIMGYERHEIESKVDAILEFADIGEFVHQPVKTYSSGMFARLAFAVAINVEPDILIVDEALAVGDMLFQQKCLQRMKKMVETGITILFVSHSLAQIRSTCKKAIYLKDGELLAYSDVADVCDLYMNNSTSYCETDKMLAQDLMQDNDNLNHVEIRQNIEKLFFNDKLFSKNISERSGGKELEFVSFRVFDDNYRLIEDAISGQIIKIVVSYIANVDIPAGTAIGVYVTDKLGYHLLSLNSNYYDFYLPALAKGETGFIEFKLKVDFLNAELVFGVGAKPHPFIDYFYDRIFGAGFIRVIGNEEMQKKQVAGLMFVKKMEISIG